MSLTFSGIGKLLWCSMVHRTENLSHTFCFNSVYWLLSLSVSLTCSLRVPRSTGSVTDTSVPYEHRLTTDLHSECYEWRLGLGRHRLHTAQLPDKPAAAHYRWYKHSVAYTHRPSQSFLTASTASRYKIGELSALRCRIVRDQFNRIQSSPIPPCVASIQYCVGWLTLKNIKIGFNSQASPPSVRPTSHCYSRLFSQARAALSEIEWLESDISHEHHP